MLPPGCAVCEAWLTNWSLAAHIATAYILQYGRTSKAGEQMATRGELEDFASQRGLGGYKRQISELERRLDASEKVLFMATGSLKKRALGLGEAAMQAVGVFPLGTHEKDGLVVATSSKLIFMWTSVLLRTKEVIEIPFSEVEAIKRVGVVGGTLEIATKTAAHRIEIHGGAKELQRVISSGSSVKASRADTVAGNLIASAISGGADLLSQAGAAGAERAAQRARAEAEKLRKRIQSSDKSPEE